MLCNYREISLTPIVEQEVACIDDSDCTVLGHKYVCYLYKCLDWVARPRCHHPHPQCPRHMRCHR